MEDVGAGSVAGRGSWPGLGRGMRLCFVLMVVAGVSGCGAARERPAVRMAESGVLPELRTAFAQVNPAATRVWILDVGTRPWGSGHPDAGDEYAVVATAWQPASEPLLNGELFGVFVVDSTFSRVNRVLHIFSTRRWHDYRVYLDEVGPDSITVLGEGEMYRDQPVGFRFDWEGGSWREFTWTPPIDSLSEE